MSDNPHQSRPVRENRHQSHVLVELRRHRLLPFGIHSGVLLDVSLNGFKIELTGTINTQPGADFWLKVPLGPLGIHAPQHLICQVECKWFDSRTMRLGGLFRGLSADDRRLIERVIETLSSRGGLSV